MSQGGTLCGHCHSQALFLVTRDAPGSPQVPACRSHIAMAMEKTAQAMTTGSVTVYLLNAKSAALGGGQAGAGDILEQVRRIGAHSTDDDTAHLMEDRLYLAVLIMIAQGAQGPSGLAAAALSSRRYEFRRWSG